jgi:conjugal transfer/type IV secretion protein DotA/TraY
VNKAILKTLLIALTMAILSVSSYAEDDFGDTVVTPISAPIITSGLSNASTGSNENIGLFIIEWVLRGISLTSPENTLFGAISGILNTLVLAFALVAIGKHGLQFVTLTTTKGTPGGSQLSGGVIAIRSSLAIAMLSPVIANGFSPVQLLVKETTIIGAHAADLAVRLSTDYLSGGSASGENAGSAISPPTLVGISDVVWAISLNEACSAAIDAYYALDTTRGVTNNSDPTPLTLRIDDGKVIYQWGWNRPYTKHKNARTTRFQDPTACGTVAINIPTVLAGQITIDSSRKHFTITPSSEPSSDEAMYAEQLKGHKLALQNAIHAMSDVITPLFQDQELLMSITALRYSSATAQQIETIQNQIATTAEQLPTEIPKYAATLIAIDRTYAKEIRRQGVIAAIAISKNSAAEDVPLSETLSAWWDGEDKPTGRTWQDALNAQGFAALGGYYWIQLKTNMAINNVQKHIAEPGAIPLIFNDDIPSETNKDLNTLQNLPNYQEIVNRLAQLKNIYLTHRPADQLEMNFQAIRNATDLNNPQGVVHTIINTSGMFILNSLEGALVNTTNNDIIINMNNLGIGLVSVTESALIGIVVAQLVTKGNFAVAIAAKLSGVSGILGVISSVVTPFLIMGLLIGLVLQFVLPAIPLIKWLVALQSWAIMMFVAMVYAPIWMMSTAAASNEDWVNDKVRDGFIMLAELILRPLLMVFGFYAAMLLMAVANIGARIAFPYLTGLADEGILSFISVGAVLILAVFISYKLVTRTFDLIYELPDFIIERMGGRPLGDAVRDDTANSTVMIAGKFTGGIGGAAAGVAKGVTKGSQ